MASLGRAGADHPWALRIQAGCLIVGVAAAWGASRWAWLGGDLEEARRLGVISATTIAGYAKSRDTHAYLLSMAAGVIASTTAWLAWCVRARTRSAPTASPRGTAPPHGTAPRTVGWSWTEVALVAAVILVGLFRLEVATNGWDAPYTFYSEEGEAVGWAQVVFDGGVLSRDTYCLYGPLATWPVAAAFTLAGPSVRVWRLTLYLMDVPALLAVYVLLREMGRRRATAWLGVALVGLHRMWPMPGMSWSLLRTGLGLAAIAATCRYLSRRSSGALVASGALLAAAVFFSQEAGVAAMLAVGTAHAIDAAALGARPREIVRRIPPLAVGFGLVALPIVADYAAHGAVASLFENMFGFAKLRVLGHGAQPFPSLVGAVHAWAAASTDATREALLETAAAYFGPALYAFVAFRLATRLLAGGDEGHVATRGALAVYGAILFLSPLSRPDTTHVLFAMPPAFVLAVDLVASAASRASRRSSGVPARVAASVFIVAVACGLASFRTDTIENAALFARQAVRNLTLRGPAPAEDGLRALDLPRAGGIRIPDDRAAEIEGVVRYLEGATAPGEPVWAFPDEPMINFLSDRPMAARYALALFAITHAQRLDLIASVERSRARYAVVNERTSMVDAIPSREQVPELWSYLEARFVPERRFGRFVVMRRAEAGEAR